MSKDKYSNDHTIEIVGDTNTVIVNENIEVINRVTTEDIKVNNEIILNDNESSTISESNFAIDYEAINGHVFKMGSGSSQGTTFLELENVRGFRARYTDTQIRLDGNSGISGEPVGLYSPRLYASSATIAFGSAGFNVELIIPTTIKQGSIISCAIMLSHPITSDFYPSGDSDASRLFSFIVQSGGALEAILVKPGTGSYWVNQTVTYRIMIWWV